MSNLAGTNPDQLPAAGDLGGMAFQDPEAVVLCPASAATPQSPGDVVFEYAGGTALVIKAKGSDGVVRSVSLVLS